MRTLIWAFLFLSLTSCAVDETKKPEDVFRTGEVTPPPYGCTDLRAKAGEC